MKKIDYLNTAVKGALAGGAVLKQAFYEQVRAEEKGRHDIVTSSDFHSEKEIMKILKGQYPLHAMVAEESGTYRSGSDYCWYIDPLDGTSNFVTGNPYFSVSVALACKGEIIAAVVYNPITEELYTAVKGQGAYQNNVPVHVNDKMSLSDSIVSSAYSSDESLIADGLKRIGIIAPKCRRVLLHFSPALDLCNIARGRLDCMFTKGSTPEDHAAGSLILSEAGGVVTNFENNEWSIDDPGIIASNRFLHDEITRIVRNNQPRQQ